MIYIARYIPVEGEIEHDDMYISGRDGGYYKKHRALKTNNTDRKAKLFLVSTDIKIGDKVHPIKDMIIQSSHKHGAYIKVTDEFIVLFESEKFFTVYVKNKTYTSLDKLEYGQAKFLKKDLFKVIGEISLDALSYCREGQEFTEDQIKIIDCGGHVECCHIGKCKFNHIGGIFVEIKGLCGHYH